MDLKRYRKTRYENIYQNIKNKNYIVTISNPKTTISEIDGKKIFDIEIAKKLRENDKIKQLRASKIAHIDTFNQLWYKYMFYNKNVLKLEYTTLKKKQVLYNAEISKYFDDLRITKITDKDINSFLTDIKVSDKQKNNYLKELKVFFNWCKMNKYILVNPCDYIRKYKVEKKEMKYWLPEHLKKILNVLDEDINNGNIQEKINAYSIKMLIIIGFSLGDRIGETRALRFTDISKEYKTINIVHSINYDPNAKEFYKSTKTEHSTRYLEISDKFINEIEKYRLFLENTLLYTISDNTPILVNIYTNKPYSDTALRKHFYYYIEKADVPKIRMYDLRHTFTTTMMSEGKDMYVISNKLGHTDINTTIKTYGHITKEIRKEMATATDKYY